MTRSPIFVMVGPVMTSWSVLEGMIISLAVAVMIMPMSPMEISFSVEMAMTLL